ncbi:Translation protein, beta-barrel domain [Pseudocohnilembus persalinus]|uniref:Translation protein, beta-barrel domain n=1 Tax=Pseudocohnilembus persalinus TaxID=266149 RepID=A0A0V0QLS1_PSEPJ|nr:Translation protein, beta-barrel domain [Pseudocohnilembus persalinus]|eukprot:KRX03195.1 Translation protein, beta-barrel domain [Pseudocohnilembus persalinus]
MDIFGGSSDDEENQHKKKFENKKPSKWLTKAEHDKQKEEKKRQYLSKINNKGFESKKQRKKHKNCGKENYVRNQKTGQQQLDLNQKQQLQTQMQSEEKMPMYIIKVLDKKGKEIEEMNLDDFIEQQFSEQVHRQSLNIPVKVYPKEDDEGFTEYKVQLINLSNERIIHLGTQMRFRLREGNGEAFYMIGVEDNGSPEGLTKQQMKQSLRNLSCIASQLKATLFMYPMVNGYYGKIQKVMVKQNIKETIKLDTRILLLGDSCSGKSTLLGVLLTGERDNGKGLARSRILTHQHEVLSGVTQTISHHFLVFNSMGQVINRTIFMRQGFFCEDTENVFETLFDMSSKILTFIDIGGHKKAEKQLMTCLCSHHPDYLLLVVSAIKGLTEVSENKIKFSCLFNLPIFVVITNLDECENPDNEGKLDETLNDIRECFKRINPEKIPIVVKNQEDVELMAKTFVDEVPIPVFLVSNLSDPQYLENYQLLEKFLNLLPSKDPLSNQSDQQPAIFLVQDVVVKEEKLILGNGIVKQGVVKKGQMLYLGPDKKENFYSVEVLDVFCKGVEVKQAQSKQICSIRIKLNQVGSQFQPTQIKKGMVCIEYNHNNNQKMPPPRGCYRFEAELLLVNDKDSIILKPGYQPVVNTTTTRQTCIIEVPNKKDKKDIIGQSLMRKHSRSLDVKTCREFKNQQKKQGDSKQDDDFEFYSKNNFSLKRKHKNSMSDSKFQQNLQLENKNQSEIFNLDRNGINKIDEIEEQKENQCSNVKLDDNKQKENYQKGEENEFLIQNCNNQNGNKIEQKKILKYKDLDMNDERIIKFEANKKNNIILRFKYNPVYIQPNEQIMIQDNSLTAIGWVKKIYY